ncbi:glycosyltransferase [Conexibacter sp. DBS9H8]|uniref:glycosyltransferase n=1 Tax=Conexibacter sp. DBS9H8 TaxID=2937801 RepID=UPI00200F8948|nr:glycosyltransferase [Conexibacter sp. DBS9H8]
MTVAVIVVWLALALLVYTQVGYGLLLALLAHLGVARADARRAGGGSPAGGAVEVDAELGADRPVPPVSVIVAAYHEQDVITGRVANLRASRFPAGRLEIIVAVDGGADPDRDLTADRARAAGADLVLELPRSGKVAAQNAAVRAAGGEILAFTDANARWEPDALATLVDAFRDARVGYACGEVSFLNPAGGTNQEGIYWRYELFLRRLESELASITAGNGAIYATRAATYLHLDPRMGHDISFPFRLVKAGWRAISVPAARATEKMAPSIEGEFARKRRMARQETWPSVILGGMFDPRGYPPLYALMVFSHRTLRYTSPLLHLILFGASLAAVGAGAGLVYEIALALQVALILGALLAPRWPNRLLLLARYYVFTTASLAVGLWDWMRGTQTVGWEPAEGTR